MIGSSAEIRALKEKLPAVVKAKRTTLISGPTGSGKEVLARLLHKNAFNQEAPFIPINCGAIPEELIESELFGHARGAFTGAAVRKGLIHSAHKGILFLDEINSASMNLQAKLLRFLESKEYRPVGSDKTETADVWVVAAVNKDLKTEVANGSFREDLMYRLSVVNLNIPPLASRKSDIDLLITHFLKMMGASDFKLTLRARELLYRYHWPGNIRELKHCIDQAIIFATNNTIDINDITLPEAKCSLVANCDNKETIVDLWNLVEENGLSLSEAMAFCEMKIINAALRAENNNRSRAAQRLRIHNRTIFKKITSNKIKTS